MRIALIITCGLSLTAYARGGGGGHGGGGSHGGGGFHGGGSSSGFHSGGGHHYNGSGPGQFNTPYPHGMHTRSPPLSNGSFGSTGRPAHGFSDGSHGARHYNSRYYGSGWGGYYGYGAGYYYYPGYGYSNGYYSYPGGYGYGTTEYYPPGSGYSEAPPDGYQGEGGTYVDPNHPDENEAAENDAEPGEQNGQGQLMEVSPSPAPVQPAPQQVAPPQKVQPAPKAQAPAAPTKEPDVFHWVDEDGVDHYSTQLAPEAKGKATKMGYDGSMLSWTPVTTAEAEAAAKQK
jgi:hypothetical protein